MDEKTRRQKYWGELLTGGMVLGLVLFGIMLLQHVTRFMGREVNTVLSVLSFGATVAILVIYGYRAARYCLPDKLHPGGFTYGRAFGFSLLVSLLAGIICGAGYFLLTEVIDPVFFGEMIQQFAEMYVSSGWMDADQAKEMIALAHNIFVVILGNMVVMLLKGGFVALFTSAFVRHRYM